QQEEIIRACSELLENKIIACIYVTPLNRNIDFAEWLERIRTWKPRRVEFRLLPYGQDSFVFLVHLADIVEMLEFDMWRTHTEVGPSDLDGYSLADAEYLVQIFNHIGRKMMFKESTEEAPMEEVIIGEYRVK
ncbi:hypothetical protein PENTCL1PPCAC_846, partial [Pristionchus entomophagus]